MWSRTLCIVPMELARAADEGIEIRAGMQWLDDGRHVEVGKGRIHMRPGLLVVFSGCPGVTRRLNGGVRP